MLTEGTRTKELLNLLFLNSLNSTFRHLTLKISLNITLYTRLLPETKVPAVVLWVWVDRWVKNAAKITGIPRVLLVL